MNLVILIKLSIWFWKINTSFILLLCFSLFPHWNLKMFRNVKRLNCILTFFCIFPFLHYFKMLILVPYLNISLCILFAYIRFSDAGKKRTRWRRSRIAIGVVSAAVLGLILLILVTWCIFLKRRIRKRGKLIINSK